MDEGILPEQWKQASVTLVFKSGKKDRVENFRPVSVTSMICRVMEKIIRNAIIHIDYLETNSIISENQHGFKKGRSCITQLLECLQNWTSGLDNKKEFDIIYLDFKAAFDKAVHKRRLNKIYALGIRGKFYCWIKESL